MVTSKRGANAPIFLLKFIVAKDDATGIDLCCIEWLLQVHHGPGRLDHWVSLVVLDELGQGVKGFATTGVVLVVLQKS